MVRKALLITLVFVCAWASAAGQLLDVRRSGDGDIRIVFDLQNVDAQALERLRSAGSIAPGDPLLTFSLPPVSYTADTADLLSDLGFTVVPGVLGVHFTYNEPELSYSMFPLNSPQRLVLDITPVHRPLETSIAEQRGAGVTYQKFVFPTAAGASTVHAITVDPRHGEFRVVGKNRDGRTLVELASGAKVAINAGYFNTTDFSAIGYLLQNGVAHSFPSRNRAVFGVLPGNEVVIDRVRGFLVVHGPATVTTLELANNPAISVEREVGTMAGRRAMGALQVVNDVVVANRVGPLEVPENGYVLVYPPHNRQLALLDAGDEVQVELTVDPHRLSAATEAVEAGPLLVQNGKPAYDPVAEQFRTGERIVDARTQQAAVGVTAAGEVVFVVAESMVAAELPSLLLHLGVVDGLRMDSGGSAALWLDGNIMNRVGALRRIQSAIVFYPGR